ncbi:hypothetical protein Acr_00g0065760 [Actinidia rufa]|uniref:Uncharacterized protein n=1 Tax=Actinidia rufa TaxID=165716 RepID=A0A7J0DQ42_9ERIC|nr:hypothetical protein Acr_00g0065760 [Actinidia rufa]
MAEPGLISPLLPKAGLFQPSDEPQFIVTVDDDRGSESLPQSTHQQPPNRSHNPDHRASTTHFGIESPFGFLGVGGFDVPATATIDPFRNQTAMIEGVYECVKILICVPIAIARLLLFGLSLSVGYVVTKIALQGWKDKENPMPKWRCRLMCGSPGFVPGASCLLLGKSIGMVNEFAIMVLDTYWLVILSKGGRY